MNYLHIIETLYRLQQADFQGFSTEEISQAEQRLQCTFPKILVEYYTTLGKNEVLNQTYNWLLLPSEINFIDDFLVFYEENQDVCCWAIKKQDLSQDNSPVYQGYQDDHGQFQWYLANANISAFWLEMACYNGTMGGGLKYHANILNEEKIKPQSMEKLVKNYQEITLIAQDNQRFYMRDYQNIISVCYDVCGACAVFAGTQDEEDFEEILELFGDENWSYVSDEDEF